MPAKTFSIMGDSISTFEGCVPDGYTLFYNDERLERSGVLRPEDTWWSHAVRGLGGTVLADSAWSGSMVEGRGLPRRQQPRTRSRPAGTRRPGTGCGARVHRAASTRQPFPSR